MDFKLLDNQEENFLSRWWRLLVIVAIVSLVIIVTGVLISQAVVDPGISAKEEVKIANTFTEYFLIKDSIQTYNARHTCKQKHVGSQLLMVKTAEQARSFKKFILKVHPILKDGDYFVIGLNEVGLFKKLVWDDDTPFDYNIMGLIFKETRIYSTDFFIVFGHGYSMTVEKTFNTASWIVCQISVIAV